MIHDVIVGSSRSEWIIQDLISRVALGRVQVMTQVHNGLDHCELGRSGSLTGPSIGFYFNFEFEIRVSVQKKNLK